MFVCLFVLLQGMRAWVAEKSQWWPATISASSSSEVSFATEYGKVCEF